MLMACCALHQCVQGTMRHQLRPLGGIQFLEYVSGLSQCHTKSVTLHFSQAKGILRVSPGLLPCISIEITCFDFQWTEGAIFPEQTEVDLKSERRTAKRSLFKIKHHIQTPHCLPHYNWQKRNNCTNDQIKKINKPILWNRVWSCTQPHNKPL